MNSYVGTVSPDTSICDGRHTWGELSAVSAYETDWPG